MNYRGLAIALAAGASTLAATHNAHAQTACSSLTNPIVVSGSTAIRPLIQRVAPLLAAATGTDQLTIVYSASGSCAGVTAIAADTTPTGACVTGGCVTGTANYWNAAGTMQSCNLDAAGTHIDVALSDVFMNACAGADVSHLHDVSTLVIPFEFLVPHASSQVAIDVREAYLVYGLGMNGMVTPWNNESFIFRRNSGSGTQVTIARSILVPETRFLGVDAMSGGNMMTLVSGATDAESTIGFVGTDSADPHRDTTTGLAYRHWGQNDYFWPNSHRDSFDKMNVRDGHYPLWGYEHAVYHVDGSGHAISARASQFADVIAGARSIPGGDIAQLTVTSNLVPTCAMQVSRTTDGGDFSLFDPSTPCGCYFDATVPMGATTCTTCPTGTCATGVCRHGYCESH